MAESPLKLQPEVMQARKITQPEKILAFPLTPPLTNGKNSLSITPEMKTIQEDLQMSRDTNKVFWRIET